MVLARSGESIFAVGATCTHYGGPLAEGLVVNRTVRCPWHHACFDLRTGDAVAHRPWLPSPAIASRSARGRAGSVGARRGPWPQAGRGRARVVIVGAGAAACAADTPSAVTGSRDSHVIAAEEIGPVDRPNLSKDYLAGKAPEECTPPAMPESRRCGGYARHRDRHVRSDCPTGGRLGRSLGCARPGDGCRLGSDRRPGSNLPHVHTLRTFADSKAIVARTAGSAPSSSAPASSGSKWPRRCARVTSRWTW